MLVVDAMFLIPSVTSANYRHFPFLFFWLQMIWKDYKSTCWVWRWCTCPNTPLLLFCTKSASPSSRQATRCCSRAVSKEKPDVPLDVQGAAQLPVLSVCAAFYLKKMLLLCFMMSPWPNGNPFSVRTARAPQRSIAEWQQHPMQPLLSNKIQLSAGSNFKVFNPRSVKARYFQWGC